VITTTGLTKVYRSRGREVLALDGVDLHVREGEVYGVIGQSGAGKSSLIRCVNLLERPTSGTVAAPGQDLTALAGRGHRAAQTPRSLDDVDAAVINGNYAIESDLKPAEDALVLEAAKGNPYGNFLAVQEGNEDDPRVKKLAELLTSDEVRKFIEDTYAGSVVASF
jgi:ABC-type multidrug transport system ATPase subunit